MFQTLNNKRLYDLLSVNVDSTLDDIKKAYKKKAYQYHPDRNINNNNNQKSEEIFKDITNAYQILSDTEKRKKYDTYGDNFEDFEDLDNIIFSSPLDIFNQLFDIDINNFVFNNNLNSTYNFNKTENENNIKSEKHNIKLNCEISIENAFNGGKKKNQICKKFNL